VAVLGVMNDLMPLSTAPGTFLYSGPHPDQEFIVINKYNPFWVKLRNGTSASTSHVTPPVDSITSSVGSIGQLQPPRNPSMATSSIDYVISYVDSTGQLQPLLTPSVTTSSIGYTTSSAGSAATYSLYGRTFVE
jgi:hypothetical protein